MNRDEKFAAIIREKTHEERVAFLARVLRAVFDSKRMGKRKRTSSAGAKSGKKTGGGLMMRRIASRRVA